MTTTQTLQDPLAAALNVILWDMVSDAHDEALDEDAWRELRDAHDGDDAEDRHIRGSRHA